MPPADALQVPRDVDLDVRQDERIVIRGPSRSGKSTLTRCINCLEEYQRRQIVEQNTPHEFFNNPQSERSKDFLSKILGH